MKKKINKSLVKVLMTQSEIAEGSGCTQTMIHYIINGDRRPSPELSETLEKATGICREAWLWPELHWNPYIPMTDPSVCLSCVRREYRVEMSCKIGLRLFKDAPCRDTFPQLLKVSEVMHGLDDRVRMAIREISDDGLHLISFRGISKVPPPKALYYNEWPGLYEVINDNRFISWQPLPYACKEYGFSKRSKVYNFFLAAKIASTFLIWSKCLCWGMFSQYFPHYANEKMFQVMRDYIDELDNLWPDDRP
jgi:hypothetical protein